MRGGLVPLIISVVLAGIVGLTLSERGGLLWIGLFLGMAFTIFVFRADEKVLPVLVILTMALGSAYRWDISARSFYLRFFLLTLVAIRGIALFFNSKHAGAAVSRHRATMVHWMFLYIGLFGLATTITSIDRLTTIQRAGSFLLLYFVVFVYFWYRSTSAEDVGGYAIALWRGLAIILGVGFVMLVIGVPGMFYGGRLRLVLGNPNLLGHYVAMMSPIALWFFFERRNTFRPIWAWGIAGASLLSLVLSGSRGGLVGAFLALGIQFSLCYRKKLAPLLVAVPILLVVNYGVSSQSVQVQHDPTFIEESLFRSDNLSTGSGRTDIWKAAVRLVQKRPFFGYGFGVVDRMFSQGYFPRFAHFQGGHVHNGYLQELVNIGWLGTAPLLLSFLFILGLGVSRLFMLAHKTTENYRLTCALFGVAVAGMFSGLVESWFTSVGSVLCFPFWFSILLFLKMIFYFNDWQES